MGYGLTFVFFFLGGGGVCGEGVHLCVDLLIS